MNLITGKVAAIVFSCLILGNAYLMRRWAGTWLFPGVLFCLFWFGYTFLPLAVLPAQPVNPWATGFLLLNTVAFSASAFVYFRWPAAFAKNAEKHGRVDYFDTPVVRRVFYACSSIALVCFFINMRIQGYSFEDMILQTIATAADYSHRRTSEGLTANAVARFGMLMAYLGVSLGGLLVANARSRWHATGIVVLSFLPSVASLLLESAKGLLFQFLALFAGCVLVTRVFQGRLYLVDTGGLRRLVMALLLIVPLTTISFLARGLSDINDTAVLAQTITSYFASYAFGPLYAFSDWFAFHAGWASDISYVNIPSAYGFYTFTPLFRILGDPRTLPAGVYEEMYSNGVITGNIYTMYRGLITDFGLIGSLVYSFISGFVLHAGFYALLMQRRPTLAVAMCIYAVGYYYSSGLISLFMYNVIPAGIVLLTACLMLSRYAESRRHRGGEALPS